ncbi:MULTISPECIES: glycine cleavage system protein R [Corallincola]|uniref:Glycine cleavage system transcriptional repressor n=3 Tax=Corallincola TaxID=1775176 RepID=A0A368NR06_9GAMM|nr:MULTISPECIES: ACT domain-containing protein [Corallincola]RCU52838.1 hypothetical protein DU002_02420 [Corallincola holothuriorum]TAA48009.1 hypothetical protein EXY25_01830 [Corallincola spongiicola]TCI03337.1 hypothetical protein EZV61_10705 [Corallincola luteus]
MSVQFMVSIVGPEHQGMLKLMAEKTHSLGGRWLDSKTNHLGGQFAGLIKIDIPAENETQMKGEFAALEGFNVLFSPIKDAEVGATVNVSYDSSDRPGLVSEITHLLTEEGVKVEHMESHRVGVVELGSNIFTAQMKLRLPQDVEPNTIAAKLESLDGDAVVNLN